MSQDLNQDEFNELADLLLISQKAKARESLCIKIGISYYKELGFIYESSEDSFVINLISHLNEVGNTKAICYLVCKELAPIFKDGKRESFLKEIAVKLNCNQDLRHNYQNPSIVEQATSPTPSPVREFGINPPLQSDGSKSQSKKLYWLTAGAIFLMGLAGFQIYNMESVNPQYKELESLLSERKWEDADHATANIMWNLAGKWQKRSLKTEDYQKLSCDDLRNIDHLWTKYSNQHFGFSIQRRIWQSSDVNSNFGKFLNHVGWGQFHENGSYYTQVTNFSLSAPEGELPWYVNWWGSGDRQAYISRIIDCGI